MASLNTMTMKTNYRKTILLIDDDPKTNLYHQTIIRELYPKATILTYLRAYHAIDYLAHHPTPDYIFVDLYMPIMSGLDFVSSYHQIFRREEERAPVILLTDHPTISGQRDRIPSAALHDVVQKPLTSEYLSQITLQ